MAVDGICLRTDWKEKLKKGRDRCVEEKLSYMHEFSSLFQYRLGGTPIEKDSFFFLVFNGWLKSREENGNKKVANEEIIIVRIRPQMVVLTDIQKKLSELIL